MAFNVKIEGIEDIRKALEGKAEEVKKAVMKDLRSGADEVIASAKSKVHSISGDLVAAINKNEARDRNGYMDIYVGIEKNEKFSKEDKYYPRFVEKGTSKMKARPYLTPALNEKKAQIQSKIESDLKAVINN